MKKFLFVAISLGLLLSACLPATATQSAPAPSVEELNATAAVLSQLTLQALPTQTVAPSNTPVVATATKTPTQGTPTETANPILLTLTATLGTGTVTLNTGTPGTPTITPTGTLPTPSVTPNPAYSATPSETPHPQHYGTMPPNLPFGTITLINRSKKEVYISLQCTTNDGEVTILEYPVDSRVKAKAPAGHYFYVAWVGTKQMTGNFGLEVKQDLTIRIYADQIEIK